MRYLILTAALWATSCFTINHDYRGAREMTPGTKLTAPSTKLADVSAEKKACFLFWGLIDLNESSGVQMLEEKAVSNHGQDFAGLTHVRIHEEQDVVDVIVEVLTLGIFSMLTVEGTAEVHQAGGGA